MANSKRTASKGKRINPKFWVFCEGKTEKAYVCFLRSRYRLPIEIIPQIIGSNIDERIINKHKDKKLSHEKDVIFLLYDADVPEVLQRLRNIREAELLVSNPSIEYWFFLHYKNHVTQTTEEMCIKELSNRNRNEYKKGYIDDKLKQHLNEKQSEACSRAKKTELYNNPSSNVYIFIEKLEKAKKSK
ncbi:MAG: RloB domain-containing protein [Bacteroidia bacterium]|nr:RloB domain-containing protein [Bacteroidia bacterium]